MQRARQGCGLTVDERHAYDIDAYDYDLPRELIAQNPVEPRDASRLLVLDRDSRRVLHSSFENLPTFLVPGDLLVMNDTRVFHARFRGRKKGGRAETELLLLKPLDETESAWEALVRPGRRLKPGSTVILYDGTEVLVLGAENDGTRRVVFPERCNVRRLMESIGNVPLPPYIRNTETSPERYQTVYAEKTGSAAAPTAGLHFTEKVFKKLRKRGIETAFLTLHVGLGTFRPVKDRDIRNHKMHEEYCSVSDVTARRINEARKHGNRVVAVGTTVVRTLESLVDDASGIVRHGGLWTKAYIYPGYSFKAVDAMLTNFHLPKSTLLLLVSAFAGRDLVMKSYEEAVSMRYRFFSFGDAMLIL
ncbi:MAG: tRNA preQ1(34) S-adenosylmethionine ribosyltransferase-isomerase QueA [Thermovirgaceae bacterium]